MSKRQANVDDDLVQGNKTNIGAQARRHQPVETNGMGEFEDAFEDEIEQESDVEDDDTMDQENGEGSVGFQSSAVLMSMVLCLIL